MGAPPCLLFFNALERGKTSVFRRFLEDVLAKQQGILYNGAIQSFRDGLESYYEDFDVDEHIEMWIEARRNGTAGVPSIRELVEDAEAIEAMILELSQTLRDLEAESDNE